MQRLLLRSLLVILSLVLSLTLAEIGVRYAHPDGGIPAAHLEATSLEQYTSVHEDAEAGYLPVLGRGEYDTHGFLRNDYDLQKRKGKRLVFAGDSVTHRRRLVNALRKVYGEDHYEYWNLRSRRRNAHSQSGRVGDHLHGTCPPTALGT